MIFTELFSKLRFSFLGFQQKAADFFVAYKFQNWMPELDKFQNATTEWKAQSIPTRFFSIVRIFIDFQ